MKVLLWLKCGFLGLREMGWGGGRDVPLGLRAQIEIKNVEI